MLNAIRLWVLWFLHGVPREVYSDKVAEKEHILKQKELQYTWNKELQSENISLQERCTVLAEQNQHLLAGVEIVNVRKAKTPFGPMDEVEEFYPDDMNVATYDVVVEGCPDPALSREATRAEAEQLMEAAGLMDAAEVPTEDRHVRTLSSAPVEGSKVDFFIRHEIGQEKI